jgi:hypothetical protein
MKVSVTPSEELEPPQPQPVARIAEAITRPRVLRLCIAFFRFVYGNVPRFCIPLAGYPADNSPQCRV